MIDTLKTFDKLIKSGLSEEHAKAITSILSEHSKKISKEFVSNKVIAALGAILFALGGFFGNQMWNMSVKLDELEYKIEKDLDSINSKLG